MVAEAGGAKQGLPRLIQSFGPNTGTLSGRTGTCTNCFTDTGFISYTNNGSGNPITINNGHSSPGDFFLWYTFHNLPAGSYSVTITETLSSTTVGVDTTSSPFETHGDDVQAWLYAANAAQDCPTAKGTTSITVTDAGGGVYTFTMPSAGDFQMYLHLQYDGGKLGSGVSENVVFSETLSATGFKSCNATMTEYLVGA